MQSQFTLLPFDDARFWAKVNFDGPLPEHHPELGPCWLWTGAVDGWGYGQVMRNGKVQRTSRYSYTMTNGTIPDKMLVCHHCDTPACVNPAHFFLGDNQKNAEDMIAKGRHYSQRYDPRDVLQTGADHWANRHPEWQAHKGAPGTSNANAKINEEIVREIRRLYAAGGIVQRELAERYDMKQATISAIILRKSWKHVTD